MELSIHAGGLAEPAAQRPARRPHREEAARRAAARAASPACSSAPPPLAAGSLFHAIGRTWLCRQRGCLLEWQVAVVESRARESGALGDDCLIDIDAVGCGAIADLAAMGLLAGQATGQLAGDERGHHAAGFLAAGGPEPARGC